MCLDKLGFIGYVCLPFAEKKSVSGVVLVTEVPILFHRSRHITGSKQENLEPFSCCLEERQAKDKCSFEFYLLSPFKQMFFTFLFLSDLRKRALK